VLGHVVGQIIGIAYCLWQQELCRMLNGPVRHSNMTLRVLQFFIPGREITLVGAVCQLGLNSILSPLAICQSEVCPATMEITAATGYEPLRGKSQRQAMRYVRNCDISQDETFSFDIPSFLAASNASAWGRFD